MKAREMALPTNDPLYYFGGVFLLTSVAGLCAIYRAGQVPEKSRVAACSVTSGLLGVAFAMYGYENYPSLPWSFAALAILAGIGGISFVDFVVTTVKTSFTAFAEAKFGRARERKDQGDA